MNYIEAIKQARDALLVLTYDPALVDALTDAIEAAQGQAVAKVVSWTNGSFHRNYDLEWFEDVEEGTLLFLAPPPQPVAVPEGWKLVPIRLPQAMNDVLTEMLTNCRTVEESYATLLTAAPEVQQS